MSSIRHTPPPKPEKLVLLHGAWTGAWVWDKLQPALEAQGWAVTAVDLPGDGRHRLAPEEVTESDYHEALAAAVGDGPAALVGHAGGGMLVTAGAEHLGTKVSHGIWISGMMLSRGENFNDIQALFAGPGKTFGVTPHVVASADGRSTIVPPEAAQHYFFHDLPEAQARAASHRLTPQPSAGRRMITVAGPGFDALPKLYVMALEDRAVLLDAQRLMCRNQSTLTVREMATSHVPHLTHPLALASVIDRWLLDSCGLG